MLDFGASRDRIPTDRLGRRIVVDQNGQEITDIDDEDEEDEADGEESDQD